MQALTEMTWDELFPSGIFTSLSGMLLLSNMITPCFLTCCQDILRAFCELDLSPSWSKAGVEFDIIGFELQATLRVQPLLRQLCSFREGSLLRYLYPGSVGKNPSRQGETHSAEVQFSTCTGKVECELK